MNKKIFILSTLMLFLSIGLYSQVNPPPPGHPPPGLPINGGMLLLVVLGTVYGVKKIKE